MLLLGSIAKAVFQLILTKAILTSLPQLPLVVSHQPLLWSVTFSEIYFLVMANLFNFHLNCHHRQGQDFSE
jgi:hypothetical protein